VGAMKISTRRLTILLSVVSTFTRLLTAATTCENLAALKLPYTSITLAQAVVAHQFTSPVPFPSAGPRGALTVVPSEDLPAFCRVAASIKPSQDSDIKFELWMPVSAWNGKFMGIGNGGWAGSINYAGMSEPLSRGYATASTDTGHEGSNTDASFALGHSEKAIDFGYRAVHEMTVQAKAIVEAYYGRAARPSYWNGCSTGGRQGLKEAQEFAADFDGIVAGAPANFFTHLSAQYVWIAQAIHNNLAGLVPANKLPVIHAALLRACDALDGVKDGLIEDPRRCRFDPKTLECQGADGPACLTLPQVELVRRVYSASINPRTKQQVFPGLMPGSELNWGFGIGHVVAQPPSLATGVFKYVTLQDPNWDYTKFDFDADMAQVDKIDHGIINAVDPDLGRFFQRGGKLLQYHGWTDQGISPLNSIDYYNRVLEAMGGSAKVKDSYRLFMVPGMDHCGGGEGPNTFDSISVIEQWVEKGKAPDHMTASHLREGKIDRTRPLCPYPQAAVYSGGGSTDDAANFSCAASR
jgi:feruloyl esterase